MSLYLGLDISTTAAKALVIDSGGRVISSVSNAVESSQPHPLWSEQDPRAWWSSMSRSIGAALSASDGGRVSAIGLTGQMHGLVILDSASQVIRPAILWNDQRTGEQCERIRQTIGRDRLIQLTGNEALTGFTAPKLLWVRENEPEAYARIRQVLLPKDYIRFCLTSEYATDLAGASGTLLMDVANRRWAQEMLEALEIPPAWLPPTHEGTDQTGVVGPQAARETGLREGTPVFAGGGDQSAQAVGVGAVTPDVVALTLGTSGVVFAPCAKYTYDANGRLHAFCHAVPGQWHLMGVMLSAAGALQWYRDNVAGGVDFGVLDKEASTVAPGAGGLVFLPYLSGERTPYPDPTARGAFVGLTTRHTRAHLTRAVMEGVAFGLRDNMELMRQAGITPRAVRASGGGVRSPVWRQILADVLEADIVTVSSAEGAAFGAALLAAVGVGDFGSVAEACARTVRETGRTEPGEGVERYREYHARYRALYPALAAEFAALSRLSDAG